MISVDASTNVVGVLLAGGRSRRAGGGDKCLRILAGETLLSRIIASVRPQVADLILNANGDPSRFNEYKLTVVSDGVGGYAGPLAGILAGLEWAREQRPYAQWIVTFPTDAPFLPPDLVRRLTTAISSEGADLACAESGGRSHPVVGIWPVRLANSLRKAMESEDMRKVDNWTSRYRLIEVTYPVGRIDPFFNANRQEDFDQAEFWIATRKN